MQYKISKSEHYTQTIEIEINELDHFTQARASIYILALLSEKHDGAKDFINKGIDKICSREKLSAEEVIYFLVSFLGSMFPC